MNIQEELQKIHHQYGTSEKANYEIQKLFDKELERSYSEEEVLDILNKCGELFIQNYNFTTKKVLCLEWFEQFKKK